MDLIIIEDGEESAVDLAFSELPEEKIEKLKRLTEGFNSAGLNCKTPRGLFVQQLYDYEARYLAERIMRIVNEPVRIITQRY
ncbi:hypothetical protein [Serratia fonticola]|uniref:hypothetical protein n=1 Tax=Serratia fonticola TaxID=47917 RepID=UPI00192CFFEA|nr:hypothetical protein [Serratia fonticola]MBL5825322.1 hypothetical protein [Serratia fonticola]